MKKIIFMLLLPFLAVNFLFAEPSDLQAANVKGKVVAIEGKDLIRTGISTTRVEVNDEFYVMNGLYTVPDTVALVQLDDVCILLDSNTDLRLENAFENSNDSLVEIWRLKSGEIAVRTLSKKDLNVVFKNEASDILIKENARVIINEKGLSYVFGGELHYFKKGYFNQDAFYNLADRTNTVKEGYSGLHIGQSGGETKINEKKLKNRKELVEFVITNGSKPSSSQQRGNNDKDHSSRYSRRVDALPPDKKRPGEGRPGEPR